MKIYIASSEKYVGRIREDMWIRDACTIKGVASEILALKDILKVASLSDVVILKSIWGYHLDPEGFTEQLCSLKKNNIKLVNDYEFVEWNIDKSKYLYEIRHISMVPTSILKIKPTHDVCEIENMISEISKTHNSDVLVIKPSISASGYLTSVYDINRRNRAIVTMLKANSGLSFIVQPYRPSIIEGEISVILIGGKALYGITRFPGVLAKKDTTLHLGLESLPESVKKLTADVNKFILKRFGRLPVICRLDFLKNDSLYEILEVELIDPDLFFRHIPDKVRIEAIFEILRYTYSL